MNNYKSAYQANTVLSFDGLIQYLREKLQHVDNNATKLLLEHVLKQVDERPELQGEIRDLTVIEKHQEILQELMCSIFSPIDFENELMAIVKPFDLGKVIFGTPKWQELIDLENFNFTFKELDFETFESNKLVYINHLILSEIYGQQHIYHKNLLITIPSKENDLNKYYKIYFNKDFTKVHAKKTPPKLSQEILELLAENPTDGELWKKHLDINNFEVHGFVILKLMDVTQNEVLCLN